MEWGSALGGFALGLLSTLLTIRLQRGWQKNDDETYSKKVVRALITEIEEANDKGCFGPGRVSGTTVNKYAAPWGRDVEDAITASS